MSKNLEIERELLSKPGDTILETLEFLKMTQAEFAERIGKTPGKVNDLISGKAPITVNTALQLEKVLGIDPEFWLNREANYREKLARIEQEEFLEQCIDWVKEQPLKELNDLGFLSSKKPNSELAEECLKFYGVASPIQWRHVYIDNYVGTDFRKSDKLNSLLSNMAAWLRIGELRLHKLELPGYNKDAFKSVLLEIKTIVEQQPEDFAEQLELKCQEVGVAVIYSKSLSKAPISGATRWVAGTPMIQITDRYKTNDHFWFTFYHEAGHILLHGKKDVFIEEFEEIENDKDKEQEANDFARDWLLPDSFLEDIEDTITEGTIRKVARKYNTHPAIVLGRLQNLNRVPFHFGGNLKVKINLDYFIKY